MDTLRQSVGSQYDRLVDDLQELRDASREIASYYHEYDYDEKTPGNGFRSFVKTIDALILRMADASEQQTTRSKMLVMQEGEVFAQTLLKSMKIARLIRSKGLEYETKRASDTDLEVFAETFKIDPQDIEPVFSELGPFFLLQSFQKDFKQNMYLVNLINSPIATKIQMVADSKFAAQVLARNANSMTIRHMKGLALRTFPVNFLLQLTSRPAGVRTQWIYTARNSEWVLKSFDTKSPVKLEQVQGSRGGFVRSLLLVPDSNSYRNRLTVRNNNEASRSVILFSHGGGFITGSPELYADFLGSAARQIGVPIIIPDYAKAPEKQYPQQLQDVMDVYLYLTSGDQKVYQLLGFHPENVVLSGDSAGSNLALSLTFALNQIRKLEQTSGMRTGDQNANGVKIPKGLALQYPSVTGFIAVPSTTLLSYDPILTVGLYALSRSFYAAAEPKIQDDLWYKRGNNVKEVMRRFDGRLTDPYYNILAYEKWAEVSDVPLFVLACEMDPILDHAILLAKRWQSDTVRLDIAKEMPHGFLVGRMSRSPAAQPHVQLAIDHMSQALGMKANG